MHQHTWRRVYEEFIMGGWFPIDWECVDSNCKKFVSDSDLTPAGLGGTVLETAARLIAPHGGRSVTSTGKPYKEQIVDEDGNLTIVE